MTKSDGVLFPTGQPPSRVHIIGGAGSGKTTLAKRLAARMGAVHYDLDLIAYEGGSGPMRSIEERTAELGRITASQKWVTEGVYTGWTKPLLEAADLIVWMDVGWQRATWRVVKRHMLASLRGSNRHPGLWKLLRFAASIRSYHRGRDEAAFVHIDMTDRPRTARMLEGHGEKVVRCRNAADVGRLMQRMVSGIV